MFHVIFPVTVTELLQDTSFAILKWWDFISNLDTYTSL